MGSPLPISQLIVLFLQNLVGMGRLTELLVDKAVLPRESLDVFRELCHFLCFELGQLSLLLDLLPHVLQLIPELLDFLFSFKQFPV